MWVSFRRRPRIRCLIRSQKRLSSPSPKVLRSRPVHRGEERGEEKRRLYCRWCAISPYQIAFSFIDMIRLQKATSWTCMSSCEILFCKHRKSIINYKKQHKSFCVVLQKKIMIILGSGYIKCRSEQAKQWCDFLFKCFSLLAKLISPHEHVCLLFWWTINRLFKLRQKTTVHIFRCHCFFVFSLKRGAQRMFVLLHMKCPAVTPAQGHTALHWGDCTQKLNLRTKNQWPTFVMSQLRLQSLLSDSSPAPCRPL